MAQTGGATALEGHNKGTSDKPPSPGPAATGIRLAGATNDVHIMDIRTGQWEKIVPQGDAPSPRAAHAAVAVGNMVVIQGGIGPAGLASEDLYVLDFTDFDKPRWHRVLVQGQHPSARYAHALSLVANRFLVAIGGNDGKQTLSDAWALDTSEKPYQWREILDSEDQPVGRMYSTAAARSDGLLLLCGGRDASGGSLSDAYGLARHRDGRWEWAAAPGKMPSARYQHAAVFVNGRLHVTGGAVGGGRMVDEDSAVVCLDTGAGKWVKQADIPDDIDLMRRCRHATAAVGPYIFIHGGLKGSNLLDDLLVSMDGMGFELSICDPRCPPWQQWISDYAGPEAAKRAVALAINAAEEAEAALAIRRINTSDDLRNLDEETPVRGGVVAQESPHSVSLEQKRRGEFPVGRDMPTPDVRLFHRAIVVAQDDLSGQLRGMVRQLSIDQFHNEGRRVTIDTVNTDGGLGVNPLAVSEPEPGIQKSFLNTLLLPRRWINPEDRSFPFAFEDIAALCDKAEEVFQREPTVLRLSGNIAVTTWLFASIPQQI